jgi:hypothetical protein
VPDGAYYSFRTPETKRAVQRHEASSLVYLYFRDLLGTRTPGEHIGQAVDEPIEFVGVYLTREQGEALLETLKERLGG